MDISVRTQNLFIFISLVKLIHSHRKYSRKKFFRWRFPKCQGTFSLLFLSDQIGLLFDEFISIGARVTTLGVHLPNWFPSILGCHLAFPTHPLGLLLTVYPVVYIYIVYIVYIIYSPKGLHNGYINNICRGKPILYIHSNGLWAWLLYSMGRYTIEKFGN